MAPGGSSLIVPKERNSRSVLVREKEILSEVVWPRAAFLPLYWRGCSRKLNVQDNYKGSKVGIFLKQDVKYVL